MLQSQSTDYYSDVYTAAQRYDISKIINGKINTASDKLRVYENDTYRHMMSETIIDGTALNLSSLN